MGYFNRKLDRDRARRAARELHESPNAALAWEAIPRVPLERTCFVRFAARDVHHVSGRRRGIFRTAYHALDDGKLDAGLEERLRAELKWFHVHLDAPERLDQRAIFFFKSNATECMSHIWVLLHALREADVWVEMQTCVNPGRVVWEDEHQVAAVPWADKPIA